MIDMPDDDDDEKEDRAFGMGGCSRRTRHR